MISGSLNDSEICTDNVRVFSYNSLRSATDDFHPSTRIGGGGFGVVYKVRNVTFDVSGESCNNMVLESCREY